MVNICGRTVPYNAARSASTKSMTELAEINTWLAEHSSAKSTRHGSGDPFEQEAAPIGFVMGSPKEWEKLSHIFCHRKQSYAGHQCYEIVIPPKCCRTARWLKSVPICSNAAGTGRGHAIQPALELKLLYLSCLGGITPRFFISSTFKLDGNFVSYAMEKSKSAIHRWYSVPELEGSQRNWP